MRRLGDVDRDHVAVVDRRDRAAGQRLGGDVAGHEAARGAGEAAVGEQRDLLAEPLAHERRRHGEHLAHPRPAGRALVADHDDVAGVDRAGGDGGHRVLLGLEHARGAAVVHALVARQLHDAALRREVAAQDREPAGRLDRVVERAHDLLARRLRGLAGVLADRPAGHGLRVLVQQPGVEQPLGDDGDAAGLVEVLRDEAAARLEVAGRRRPARRCGRSRRCRARRRPRGRARAGAARRWSSRRWSRSPRSRSPAPSRVMMSRGRWPRASTSMISAPASVATRFLSS